MKFNLILKLSEKSLKLCGFEFHTTWGKEDYSRHGFWKFFEVKKELIA